jgi:pimeloyl-ACP methyl ester carboxylesterase
MVGCSAGSLAATAVVARMPESFDAAVLVGSGANLLEISQTSDLTDGGIHLAWPDNQPVGPWREELFHQYLTYSTLDPYHTARFLRNKPTLLVQANLDRTVPASNGWLLWDRLGRPDRYTHVGEHRTLFLTLKGQSRRVADWLDTQMENLSKHGPIAGTTPGPQTKPEAATTH